METCPSEDELVEFIDARLFTTAPASGELPPPRLDADRTAWIGRHADECARCRDLIAGVARTEGAPRTTGPVTATVGPTGERIGRYQVTRPIGAGAMGAVYEAYDPELDRKVALKLVRVAGDGVEYEAATRFRFVREAQALARLSHSNVIHVYEVGAHESFVFIAMELIDGPNLRQWLSVNRPSWREVLRLFAQAGAGLEAAHRAGLVHRDFKPDNVLVGRDGRVTVSDFGLARAASGQAEPPSSAPRRFDSSGVLASPITRTGALLGTPAYMAPEQLESKTVDARADLFSFSVALYEGLHGHRPFAGETLSQILENARGDRVIPPTPGRVPEAVSEVVARGLRARPGERWGSMGEMLAALDAAAPPDRARPARLWLYAAGAALAVVGGGAGWWGWHARALRAAAARQARATAAPLVFHPKNPRRITFTEGCELSPSLSPDGKMLVYKAMGNMDSAPLFLRPLADAAARQITPAKAYTFNPAISPDGTTIAYKRWSKERPLGLYLVPLAGEGEPRLLTEGVGHPSWTCGGKSLWGENRSALVRVRASDGTIEETIPAPGGFRPGPVLERDDGSLVAVFPRYSSGTNDGGVALIAPPGGAGARAVRWLVHGDYEEALALSPDARHALVVSKLSNGEPSLFDVPLDGSPVSSLAGSGIFPSRGIAVTADGRQIVWSTCRDYVRLARLGKDGTPEDLEPGHGWEDRHVDWLPHADRLVVLSSRAGHGLQPWLVDPAHKEPPRMVAVGDRDVSGMAPSPDGTLLAFSATGGGILVVPVDGSSPPRPVTHDPADLSPTFRRGGNEILFERQKADGTSRIMAVPVGGGEPRVLLEGHVRTPAASPIDDRFLYLDIDATGKMRFTLFDPLSGKGVDVSPSVPQAYFVGGRFSLDGSRAAVISGGQSLIEVDLTTRKVTWRSGATDGIESFAYTQDGIVLTHTEWSGDLWVADDPF